MGGFVSKWYLCMGALSSHRQPFAWIGVVVLLISALLTAGYLLPILVLTILALVMGLFPNELIRWFTGILA